MLCVHQSDDWQIFGILQIQVKCSVCARSITNCTNTSKVFGVHQIDHKKCKCKRSVQCASDRSRNVPNRAKCLVCCRLITKLASASEVSRVHQIGHNPLSTCTHVRIVLYGQVQSLCRASAKIGWPIDGGRWEQTVHWHQVTVRLVHEFVFLSFFYDCFECNAVSRRSLIRASFLLRDYPFPLLADFALISSSAMWFWNQITLMHPLCRGTVAFHCLLNPLKFLGERSSQIQSDSGIYSVKGLSLSIAFWICSCFLSKVVTSDLITAATL